MKAELLNLKGKSQEKGLTLNKAVWEVELNEDLVTQVLYIYRSNQRTGNASAKTRAEVRGGGRKPWKQKGTGRARAGSIRSPLWKGGGVTFVPTGRNWKKRINKRVKRQALAMVLSDAMKKETVKFYTVDTKATPSELRVSLQGKKVLVVTDMPNVYQAMRNVEGVTVTDSATLTTYDVVNAPSIVMTEEVVSKVEGRLTNGK